MAGRVGRAAGRLGVGLLAVLLVGAGFGAGVVYAAWGEPEVTAQGYTIEFVHEGSTTGR
ncbi:MAG: hypothetical protein Q4C85_01625 [Actinomyces sp.]|uniref:hypothetical protein n=1 Tax=Actinomyces sp. TaxID=29317 RepID=UPI0026DDC887|nr:hypothetical protein [Actinomyces sp.]MDO4242462.1 hypothetical protein [Actinomyces sp.]